MKKIRYAIAFVLGAIGCFLVDTAERIDHDAIEWGLARRLI